MCSLMKVGMDLCNGLMVGNLYAEKLKQHGVDVTHKTVYGVVHSYMHLYAVEPKAVEYRKFTINWLQEQYAKATKQT